MIGNNLLSLSTLQKQARDLAMRIGQSGFVLRSEPAHDGSAHLEVDDAYHLVVTERGLELERKRTSDAQELLYWVIEGLTSSMSWDYEVAHRREGEDSRRQGFAKQVELLSILSSEWADRRMREQAEILKHHPFRDD